MKQKTTDTTIYDTLFTTNLSIMKTSLTIITILIVIALASSIQAATIYVDGSKTGGDGNSWATAYGDLQTAIDNSNAANGDEIWVKNGTYKPHATDRTVYFTLKNGIAIYGGFSGTETILQQRNEINTATILSGDIGTNNDNSDNSYTVVYGVGLSNTTILDGFIITDGNADGIATVEKNGGGLFIDGSNLTIKNIQFLQNLASGLGGAIYNAGVNNANIELCIFTDNQADTEGGAIYNAGISGGNSSPTILHCDFTNNASHFGGAIYNNGNVGISSPKILSCEFTGNNAIGGGSIAGAIYNFAKDGGTASPEVTNCTFYGNASVSSAGAFYSLGDNGTSTPSINNCTFFLNSASTGGAVYVNESNAGDAEITINNTIFWNNSAGYNPTFQMSSSGSSPTPTINLNHILIDAIDCNDVMFLGPNDNLNCLGVNIYNQNPKFVNGFAGNFELQDSSPAIEGGLNAGIPAGTTTDKAGNARIMFSIVDIGAFENVTSLPIELSSFDAFYDQDKVQLSWTTLSETNNDYFTVERSIDGDNFKAIDRKSGAGHSTSPLRYRSDDHNPSIGLNYYRLKQTDFDGTSTYSDIKVVKIQSGKIEVYPNPVADRLYIATSDYEDGTANFSIYNLKGKEVYRGAIEVNSGLSVIRLDEMANLIPGSYLVRMYHEKNGSFSKRFVKVGL